MKQSNKYSLPREPEDTWLLRMVRYLREWPARNGRTVHEHMIRGASYGIGSGAVSLLVLWIQTRR